MLTKAQKLREMFKKDGLIRLVGSHNGLTAKLVEKNGFEGVWASGLEISASHAVPDANILTMSDFLAAAINMNDAVSIPVVADCDTGFGNSSNAIQMVKKYESAGIAAVCIEDKLFPKVNSYIPGRQELASIPEFVGKIMAGKNAQRTEDFMIFARIEALIAGWGQEEALKRAKAYADAGADAILIHSKQKNPDEIIEFVKAWNNYKPLIIVPTSYPSLKENQMKELGIKMVIYANQGLRSAIKSINETLSYVNQNGILDVGDKIATMTEVFELQNMPEMKENEKKYLRTEKGEVKVIIPAAGDVSKEESFKEKDLLKDIPVTMLDINGKPILQRIIENLNAVGIQDITVVTGYKGDKIFNEGITKVENPNYQTGGVMGSIMAGSHCLTGDKNLIVYSDILFDRDIIEKLLRCNGDIVLVIDSSYQEYKFPKKNLDLVVAKYPPVRGERIMTVRQVNQVLKIGKNIPRQEANYEFTGIAMFSKRGMEILTTEYQRLKEQKNDNLGIGFIDTIQETITTEYQKLKERNGGNFEIGSINTIQEILTTEYQRLKEQRSDNPGIGFIDMIQEIINKGYPVEAIEINGGWTEIKNFDDYKRACGLLKENK